MRLRGANRNVTACATQQIERKASSNAAIASQRSGSRCDF
jgi:hypothetical protein